MSIRAATLAIEVQRSSRPPVSEETARQTCLLIPDFASDKKVIKETPAWRIQQLTALLTERWSQSNMQTVLYARSVADIRKEYGGYVSDLVKNHYIEVAVS
jgi:hypothetical protein